MTSRWHSFAATATLTLAAVLNSCTPSSGIQVVPLEAPLVLRMVPPEGQVSRYAHHTETSMEGPMMPSTDGPLMTMRWQQIQTVLSVEDEVARVRSTVDSAITALNVDMPMPGMEAMMPDLSRASFTVDMDPRGSVLHVLESAGVPVGITVEDLLQGPGALVLPEAEVSPGDSWMISAPTEVSMGAAGTVSMDLEFTYTFVSLADGLATLSFEGPMNVELDVQGMAIRGSGSLSGMLVVDLVEGRYVSQTSDQTMEMDLAGTTMTLNTTTSLELMPGG